MFPDLAEKIRKARGAQKAPVKKLVSLRLDPDVLEKLRASGPGWQSRANAVLRKADRLVLIDAEGHELEPISAARAKGMMILGGLGAGQQVVALSKLLEAAPALDPQVQEAQWVGNRRWNLTFKTGQVLALPQGERDSATALVSFARLDGVNRLLGGKVASFDMRAPERIYMRIPGRSDPQPLPAASGDSGEEKQE